MGISNAQKYQNAKSKEPNYNRRRSLQYRYGLTVEQYDAMMASQNGACAICKSVVPLVVDHSHTTNEVRGLLCNNCNGGIGLLRDDVTVLTSAITYLGGRSQMVEAPDCDSG